MPSEKQMIRKQIVEKIGEYSGIAYGDDWQWFVEQSQKLDRQDLLDMICAYELFMSHFHPTESTRYREKFLWKYFPTNAWTRDDA